MEKANNSTIFKSLQESSPIKDDQVQDQSSRSWLWQQNSGPEVDQQSSGPEVDQDLDNDVQDSEVTEGVGEQVRGPETVQENPNDQDLENITHQIKSLNICENEIGKKIEVIFNILKN